MRIAGGVTLGVNQYEERLKMPPELNTVRVSYLPLVTVAPADNADCDAAGAVRNSEKRGMAVP